MMAQPQHAARDLPHADRGAHRQPQAGLAESAADLSGLMLLYTGIATPTEIGALARSLAAVIGAMFGRLTWPEASTR